MIRALIVDDEAPARDKLRRWLVEHADVEIAGEAPDGLAAAEAIAARQPDVVYLDVQMPGLSGLEVAAQLDPRSAPLIVFVTAYDEHAVRAFDLDAVDYLLKPYDRDRLRRSVSRVRDQLAGGERPGAVHTARKHAGGSARLLVPAGECLQVIDSRTVHWLEAADNYVHVHTAARSYLLRRTLQDLLAQLGDEQFVRIHKSAAVNLAEIQSLAPLFKGDYEVVLRSGRELRLSRRYRAALFARMQR